MLFRFLPTPADDWKVDLSEQLCPAVIRHHIVDNNVINRGQTGVFFYSLVLKVRGAEEIRLTSHLCCLNNFFILDLCVCQWVWMRGGGGGGEGGGRSVWWWWARQWDDSYLALPSYSQQLFSLDPDREYSVNVWISLKEHGIVGAARM